MFPVHKVAIIQTYAKPLDIEYNYNNAVQYIRQAASEGAMLAVLPEYFLTSWVPEDPKFTELCGEWATYLKRFQALARECDISIVPGTIVERTPEPAGDDSLLNVAYFIDNHGEILGRYVKRNLWHSERPFLTSSGRDAHEVFDTPLGKVGLLICWDLAFPEAFRELIARGAKIIIVTSYWTLADASDAGLLRNPRAEALFLDSILTARAFENTCAVVFSNCGGPSSQGYAGLSQVTVPYMGAIARLGESEEGMKIVDIDMKIMEEAEETYRVRRDLTSEHWHYDYRPGEADRDASTEEDRKIPRRV